MAIINDNGEILKEGITCPTCGKEVRFVDSETVHCKKCSGGRNWSIVSLIKTLRGINDKNISFIETR